MKKKICAFILTFIMILSLAGCGNATYNEYKDTTLSLPKDNCFEKVSKKSLVSILEKEKTNDVKNEITYVFYGTAEDTKCCSVINIIHEQSKQYDIDLIYYINCDSVDTREERDEYKADLQMTNPESLPSFLVYVDGVIKYDGSKTSFMSNSEINSSYTNFAYLAFVELPASLK